MADTQRLGRHRQTPSERPRKSVGRRWANLAATIVVALAVAVAAIVVAFGTHSTRGPVQAEPSPPSQGRYGLPTTPASYVGLAPESYAQVNAFTRGTGVKPRVLVYYSGWPQPFRAAFAAAATKDGAVPLVQMNPTHISIAAIAAGQYDSYLRTYAMAVRAFGHPIILSFGHEMNGNWYSWGYSHTSPAVFVAAWQHVVTLFRKQGAQKVTWLWTINTIHEQTGVPSPKPWWPGSTYVNWVGIDGYYINASSVFASVFGPTIVAVRGLTHDPVLIAETSATPASVQPTKIANLFAGVRLYGLLGFVWFDADNKVDWRISSSAALAAFRRGAETYFKLAS